METEMVNAWDTWYESGKAENANLRIAFDAGYKAALAELNRQGFCP